MRMRELLIRAIIDVPFHPFILRLQGGFETPVTHPEFIVYIPGVEEITIFDTQGYADTFHAHRIVSLRRFGGPAIS